MMLWQIVAVLLLMAVASNKPAHAQEPGAFWEPKEKSRRVPGGDDYDSQRTACFISISS